MDVAIPLLSALFGAVLGAVLGTAGVLYFLRAERRAKEQRIERQGVEMLFDQLHVRRAFMAERVYEVDPTDPDVLEELALAMRSVLKARDAVRDARHALQPGSVAFDGLRAMDFALNRYLMRQLLTPERYLLLLQHCRVELNAAIDELSLRTGIPPRYAGEGATWGEVAVFDPE